MGTMADSAMPLRSSGNSSVVGSKITSEGQSERWQTSKRNVCHIVNQFLSSNDERKQLASGSQPTFDTITADQACNEQLYEEFTSYLANKYKCGAGKNKDKHLKVGPAVNYLKSIAKQLSNKCKTVNDKTKYFFTCKDLNGSSDPWVWFNSVSSNMHRIISDCAAKRGEDMDESAPAIYPTYVDKISQALMEEGSEHSSVVKVTDLTTCTSALNLAKQHLGERGIQDDDEFNILKGLLPQIKKKKTKMWLIPPLADCHRSWHLAYGNFLALVQRHLVEYEPCGVRNG